MGESGHEVGLAGRLFGLGDWKMGVGGLGMGRRRCFIDLKEWDCLDCGVFCCWWLGWGKF